MAASYCYKLVVNNRVRTLGPSSSLSSFSGISTCSRRLHESVYEREVENGVDVYEKEVENEVESEVLEIALIEDMSHKPEEYWEPDPDTGVFVPAGEQNTEEPAVTCTTEETILDEKSFFRPQEDLELPATESFTGEIPPVDPFAE